MTAVPVLLLIFKRPDTTAEVMRAIRLARPDRLYVAADGPRDRPGEAELCAEALRVAQEVDWPCEVKVLARKTNLGCRVGVSTALDWFFEHEEEGIILEDDCVPSPSFFRYCADLLERFRDDERVMCVSGDNFQQGRQVSSYSYYFSRYMHCWGWATWRRAWKLYDRDMSSWPQFRDAGGLLAWADGDPSFVQYWTGMFETAAAGRIDSWAYRYLFSCWAQNGLTCLPEKNLVSNIGFGSESTHTSDADNWQADLVADEISFPLRHPPTVVRSASADAFEQLNAYELQSRGGRATFKQKVGQILPDPLVNLIRRSVGAVGQRT